MRFPIPSPFLFAGLVACGSGDGETPDDPTTGLVDDVAPTVIGSSPEAGARGVDPDAPVTITFSEPMDTDSVEAQLDLTELGDAMATWSQAGDILTLTPESPFEMVVAPADGVTPAAGYRVVIGGDATDLAGNPLGTEFELDFTAIRELWWLVGPEHALTRSVTPSELAFGIDDPLVVGDDDADEGYRVAMTFGLDLPSEPQEIVGATLRGVQQTDEIWGQPYDGLGTLLLDHVTYDDLESESAINAAFNASQSALRTFGGIASTPKQTDIEVDVLDAVVADHGAGRAASQFLLYFDGFTDLDGVTDRAVFSRDELRLEVRWLTP